VKLLCEIVGRHLFLYQVTSNLKNPVYIHEAPCSGAFGMRGLGFIASDSFSQDHGVKLRKRAAPGLALSRLAPSRFDGEMRSGGGKAVDGEKTNRVRHYFFPGPSLGQLKRSF
jgi:hypothetical protein